ncbi:MAG TPA: D-aminoacylase [Dissulfurispiraceae bacterium]|nr:D-aminoacylase [Dissulfurispiraceae bacterium]
MIDYLLTKGRIIDGTGGEPLEANLGIQDDRIAYVGRGLVQARETIDVEGLVVSPGFIDTHGHSEFNLLADGRAEGKLSQGVTTEINGNCGLSAAPLHGEALEHRLASLEELGIEERWSTFGEYFTIMASKGIAINFATLCGHGNLRASVIGYRDVAPSDSELSRMKALLRDALREGAKGLSTGLIYPPGVYADTEELIELSRAAVSANTRSIYASHMRDEGDALIEAIEEVLRIGRETPIPVHISHIKTAGEQNWPKIETAIGHMSGARASGVALTCDRYPYIASSTDLDSVLPPWVYDGGVEEELKRLRNESTREKIITEILSKDDRYWGKVYISSVISGRNKWMEGESILGIAERQRKRPQDVLVDVLIEEETRVGAIFFSMSEENLRRFLGLSYAMIGSDSSVRSFSGPTVKGKPHPRGFGTFPRFIGSYVRDLGLIGLSEAIRRITLLPALTFNLNGRGLIKEGSYADVTVFDYNRIIDRATFSEPFVGSEGIAYVFVNGMPALREGGFTGSHSGRILR